MSQTLVDSQTFSFLINYMLLKGSQGDFLSRALNPLFSTTYLIQRGFTATDFWDVHCNQTYNLSIKIQVHYQHLTSPMSRQTWCTQAA